MEYSVRALGDLSGPYVCQKEPSARLHFGVWVWSFDVDRFAVSGNV